MRLKLCLRNTDPSDPWTEELFDYGLEHDQGRDLAVLGGSVQSYARRAVERHRPTMMLIERNGHPHAEIRDDDIELLDKALATCVTDLSEESREQGCTEDMDRIEFTFTYGGATFKVTGVGVEVG